MSEDQEPTQPRSAAWLAERHGRESEDTAPGQRPPTWSGGWFGLRGQGRGEGDRNGHSGASRPDATPPGREPSGPGEGGLLPAMREVTPPTGRRGATAAPGAPQPTFGPPPPSGSGPPSVSGPPPESGLTPPSGSPASGPPTTSASPPPPLSASPSAPAPGAASRLAATGSLPAAAPAPADPAGGFGGDRPEGRPRFEPAWQVLPQVSAPAPAGWRPYRAPTRPAPPPRPAGGGEQVRFLPPNGNAAPVPPPVPTSPYPPAPPFRPEADITRGEHRLHMATVPLRVLMVTLVFFATLGVALLGLGPEFGLSLAVGLTLVVSLVSCAYSVAAWQATTFELREDHLVLRTGLLRRVAREVPLSRLQAVDIVRPLIIQVLGLAELRVELAGGDRGEVRLRYLSLRTAQRLRAAVLAHAAGLAGQTPEAPEWRFFHLSFGRLLGALAFRIPVLAGSALFLALIAVGIVFAELGVLGGAIPLLLALMRGFLGPLLRYTDFRASLSPDGLRLRYGVLQTRMQTVPPGRVQAIRIVQPVLWRALGVVRLEANVAGYVGERQMDSSTLLPVVPRNLAFTLVDHLFPGTDVASVRLEPARRGWSRYDALGVDDTVLVTRRGLLCRVTEIVPHVRVQDIRLVEGPVSRLLGVASVVVDTAPGPARAWAVGRDRAEACRIVETVAAHAREARAGSEGPERWVTRGDIPAGR